MTAPIHLLEYAEPNQHRPRWITRLASISQALAVLGIAVGALRAWNEMQSMPAFSATARPASWRNANIEIIYLILLLISILGSTYLAAISIISLIRPQRALFLFWGYVYIKLLLIPLSATFRVLMFRPSPTSTFNTLFVEGTVEILLFGGGLWVAFVAYILYSRNPRKI